MLVLWRLVIRLAFRWNILGKKEYHRVLILGAGDIGRRIESQIRTQPFWGLKIVGFLDDNFEKVIKSLGVFGGLDNVRSVIQEQKIDDVIIALPRSAYDRINKVASELHVLPVRVWVIPDYFSMTMHRASIEEFAGIPMLNLRAPALNEYQRMLKRGFDILVTLFMLRFLITDLFDYCSGYQIRPPREVYFTHR